MGDGLKRAMAAVKATNKKRGRPEKAAGEKRTESLVIRLTAEDMAACLLAAGEKSLSDWARGELLKEAGVVSAPKDLSGKCPHCRRCERLNQVVDPSRCECGGE